MCLRLNYVQSKQFSLKKNSLSLALETEQGTALQMWHKSWPITYMAMKVDADWSETNQIQTMRWWAERQNKFRLSSENLNSLNWNYKLSTENKEGNKKKQRLLPLNVNPNSFIFGNCFEFKVFFIQIYNLQFFFQLFCYSFKFTMGSFKFKTVFKFSFFFFKWTKFVSQIYNLFPNLFWFWFDPLKVKWVEPRLVIQTFPHFSPAMSRRSWKGPVSTVQVRSSLHATHKTLGRSILTTPLDVANQYLKGNARHTYAPSLHCDPSLIRTTQKPAPLLVKPCTSACDSCEVLQWKNNYSKK